MFAQIAGAFLLLGAMGCVRPARCPVPRTQPPASATMVYGGTLSFDDGRPIEERIVVARVRLAAGTRLRTSLLRVVPRPAGLKWSGHLRPVDLVHFAGRRLRRNIPRGASVRRADLEVGGAAAPARVRIPPGGRAVTLRVDWMGGTGTWVRPGDVVDVAVVTRTRGRGRRGTQGDGQAHGSLAIRMLMQSARVVAAEQWVIQNTLRTRRPWCTLLALPREAQALALAQRMGRIVIFRRNNRDRRRAVYQPVTRRHLESPRFWRDLQRNRLRTIQRHGLPDDPGIRMK